MGYLYTLCTGSVSIEKKEKEWKEIRKKSLVTLKRKMFKASDGLFLLAVIALVIGVVLMLTIVLQDECEVDSDFDKHNTTRATLFLLLAFALAIFVLVVQRRELRDAVSSALM